MILTLNEIKIKTHAWNNKPYDIHFSWPAGLNKLDRRQPVNGIIVQQDRKCAYEVTLSRLHITIATVEKQ